MPSEKIQEALSYLQDDWPIRVLLSALAERVAELAALLSQAEAQKLPPEFRTRIQAIEEEMHELSRLCQNPPLPRGKNATRKIDSLPLF
jgi:cell division protein ZapA (FtsZ GTPase activity inhibitor)